MDEKEAEARPLMGTIFLVMSCNVLLVCHELCKQHIILILY